jgi:hypothetical protein
MIMNLNGFRKTKAHRETKLKEKSHQKAFFLLLFKNNISRIKDSKQKDKFKTNKIPI